jgi:DNA-binding protein
VEQSSDSNEKKSPTDSPRTPSLAQPDTVLVGQKPPMSYVTAVLTHFERGSKQVHIKARGRAITRAVDTAEILRRNFMKNAVINDISITTETVELEGKPRNISAIKITLGKE